jgi:hypothetical protein
LIRAATKLTAPIGQQPTSFAIVSDRLLIDGQQLPLAMIAMVENYRSFERKRKSTFVWFVSTISTLDNLVLPSGAVVPKALGAAALDVARVRSYLLALEGRVTLHASPEGGQRLLDFYDKQGMSRWKPFFPRISWFRKNDGRYFFYTVDAAAKAHGKMDVYR